MSDFNLGTLVAVVISLLGIVVLLLALPTLLAPPPRPSAEVVCAMFPTLSLADCQSISDRHIWLGMTDQMALMSRGKPSNVNRSVGSWGVHEQWVYGSYEYGISVYYFYFENGILTSWQD